MAMFSKMRYPLDDGHKDHRLFQVPAAIVSAATSPIGAPRVRSWSPVIRGMLEDIVATFLTRCRALAAKAIEEEAARKEAEAQLAIVATKYHEREERCLALEDQVRTLEGMVNDLVGETEAPTEESGEGPPEASIFPVTPLEALLATTCPPTTRDSDAPAVPVDALSLGEMARRAADRPGRIHQEFIAGLETHGASDGDMERACYACGDLDEFGADDRLGGGGFGDVFRVTHKGQSFALKISKDSSARNLQLREMIVLKSLIVGGNAGLGDGNVGQGKDYIIQVVAMDDEKPHMPILMELARGDLWNVLLGGNRLLCTFKDTVRFLAEMTDALNYVHSKGFIHRDVKPDNMLIAGRSVGAPLSLKLADFGLAKSVGEPTGAWGGTVGYFAPECFRKTGPARIEHDIFSAGVIAVLAVLRTDLRENNLFVSKLVTTAEERATMDDITKADGVDSFALRDLRDDITARTLRDNSITAKLLKPENLRWEVPSSMQEWVCEALGGPVAVNPNDRSGLSEVKAKLRHLCGSVSSTLEAESRSAPLHEPGFFVGSASAVSPPRRLPPDLFAGTETGAGFPPLGRHAEDDTHAEWGSAGLSCSSAAEDPAADAAWWGTGRDFRGTGADATNIFGVRDAVESRSVRIDVPMVVGLWSDDGVVAAKLLEFDVVDARDVHGLVGTGSVRAAERKSIGSTMDGGDATFTDAAGDDMGKSTGRKTASVAAKSSVLGNVDPIRLPHGLPVQVAGKHDYPVVHAVRPPPGLPSLTLADASVVSSSLETVKDTPPAAGSARDCTTVRCSAIPVQSAVGCLRNIMDDDTDTHADRGSPIEEDASLCYVERRTTAADKEAILKSILGIGVGIGQEKRESASRLRRTPGRRRAQELETTLKGILGISSRESCGQSARCGPWPAE